MLNESESLNRRTHNAVKAENASLHSRGIAGDGGGENNHIIKAARRFGDPEKENERVRVDLRCDLASLDIRLQILLFSIIL